MATMKPGDDPRDHTPTEVNAYLRTADYDERFRVLDLEQGDAGKHRLAIIDGPTVDAVSEGRITAGQVAPEPEREPMPPEPMPRDEWPEPEVLTEYDSAHG